jgi:hypothetical protein
MDRTCSRKEKYDIPVGKPGMKIKYEVNLRGCKDNIKINVTEDVDYAIYCPLARSCGRGNN